MIEQGLYELITSDSSVDDLVGGVYAILAPKGAVVPYIVYNRIATSDTYTMAGPSGLRAAVFQFDCYATDYYTSRAISLALRQLLESYQGNLPDTNSTTVTAVLTEKDWDMPYEEGAKGFVYRALLQFRIWYYDTSFTLIDFVEGGTF